MNAGRDSGSWTGGPAGVGGRLRDRTGIGTGRHPRRNTPVTGHAAAVPVLALLPGRDGAELPDRSAGTERTAELDPLLALGAGGYRGSLEPIS